MTLLSERLQLARQELFVGRAAERALFESALTGQEQSYCVLHVYGLGGVGKTMLLREFAALCGVHGVHSISIDARNIDPSPDAFMGALALADGQRVPESLAKLFASRKGRFVIFIDTCELLAPLDHWLREEFLPQLPDHGLVVLAGRQPPDRNWHLDAGWQNLLRTLPLRNLSPEESHSYLSRRNVPEKQHPAILSFTHGHPLALSLVADLFAQHKLDSQISQIFAPEGVPDTVKVLVEHLVQEVASDRHRAAIEVCALVRLTTESLLHEMLPIDEAGGASAHDLFAWLRSLSFIEVGAAGVFPHDLAREAIAIDLRWRDPEAYIELHHRARNYYATRLQQTSGQQQQDILLDYIFLHRNNAVVRPFMEWREHGNLVPSPARENEIPQLLSLVEKHEGAHSAQIAGHWFERQLEGVLVLRDGNGHIGGFLATVALQNVTSEDASIDPAVQAASDYLRDSAPLRTGEVAFLSRFWMAADTYQSVSPAQSLIVVKIVQQYLTTPGLAFTFLPCADPDFWAPIFAYADATRIQEADFEVGGRQYGAYGHDWRVVPPLTWLGQLADREISSSFDKAAPPAVEQLVVLSEAEFGAAVQAALRHWQHPSKLRNNPLLRSRLITERCTTFTDDKKIETLQQIVRSACDDLQHAPRTTKFYWPLYHTYLHPARSQEQAAELMDVPFSTFRRHLKEGVARVIEALWQQEVRG